ncbi:D-amino-acid dehydrogenase [Pustulibacterium marinum]|uniref:D-amino-acid dehydrogenase n=1 Tax=Pustulibacterium marinum TaxID=1224947 RepID=A0A1I7GWD5_9FLAO|nr:FAD-dependent oxidoreductase [Pustulibacterium marinum]SFU52758.1 D-amino-acid dehydrogenase [Pustulibacterium marinum]
MKKVVIIGGGVIGLCSAYYLVKKGLEVTVVDKDDITTGASFINAGYITPSHFVPIAEPGMITQGIKWMFNSASPFYIKPRLDTDFFKWSLNFKKSATHQKVAKAIPIIKELNLKSRDLYFDMLAQAELNFHMERKGLLMLFNSEKNLEHETKLANKGNELGLQVTMLNQQELREVEPVVANSVLGAAYYECDAHGTPNQFMTSLKAWLASNGVQFYLNEKVKDIISEGNKISKVITTKQELTADEFVLAAGSWTFQLAKKLGLNIPIQAGKGYSMNVERPTGINYPAILTEAKCAVTPMDGFTRFAGTMELSGINTRILPHRVAAIANAASTYYKDVSITEEEQKQATSGLRPVSPDGLPFIGKSSKHHNLTIASGHAMMGFSLGPITGKLVEELIFDKKTSIAIKSLALNRFY